MPGDSDEYSDYLFSQPESSADNMYHESLAESNIPQFFEPDEIRSHFFETFEFAQLRYIIIDIINTSDETWLSIPSCSVLEIKTKGQCKLEYIIKHAGKTLNDVLNPKSSNEEQLLHLYKYDLKKVGSLLNAKFLLQENIEICLKLWEPTNKLHNVYIGIF